MAAEYVDRIAKGDIPPKITDQYNGDFNEIKNNLNECIDAVNLLIADANALSQAAVAGKLVTRADASKHHGDFRKIVQGVNDTLDAVIGPLDVAAEYVDRVAKGDIPAKVTDNYNGDFNEIKNNLNGLIDALNDITRATREVASGNLTIEVKPRSEKDELMKSLTAMVGGLKGMALQTQQSAVSMTSATAEILASSTQMASTTREQASAVNQVSSTIKGDQGIRRASRTACPECGDGG